MIKNELYSLLDEAKQPRTSAIIVDGKAVAFRPNVTDEINPRIWYDHFKKGKISENQFFRALNVSVTEARLAIGEDQLADVKNETLSKTPDLRIIDISVEDSTVYKTGDVIPFAGANVQTSKQSKVKEVDNAGTPLEAKKKTKPNIKKSSRFIRKVRA